MFDSSRRHFIKSSATVALGFGGLGLFSSCRSSVALSNSEIPLGFGPFLTDPNGILNLPAGFSYRILSRSGERMSDGFFVPAKHDGMAAFPGPNGLTLLVRNHEISPNAAPTQGPFGADNALLSRLSKNQIYDVGSDGDPCLGGTTTLVYDTRRQELVSHHLSMVGTLVNCAGGPTPWNTWISCEETTDLAGDRCARDHGWCFEVPVATAGGPVQPIPLKALGRFKHEAVAVEPTTGIVYETEDIGDGLLYRFVPTIPGNLRAGGRLQALSVRERLALDTRNWEGQQVELNVPLETTWIDLEDVEAPENDLRFRGFQAGAARFARGEGIWYADGTVYFACTNGGEARIGQIWKYTPSPFEGTDRESEQPGILSLFIEATEAGLIENCDNLTTSPWGDLFVCEDGSGDQYLVGITPRGEIYRFAHNAISNSEFAGVTFSPDGSTLFVNIQHDGLTLAITGPWHARTSSV